MSNIIIRFFAHITAFLSCIIYIIGVIANNPQDVTFPLIVAIWLLVTTLGSDENKTQITISNTGRPLNYERD
jgi:hypothetical protein